MKQGEQDIEHGDFNFTITAPAQPGTYQTTWRFDPNGFQFALDMWIVVNVPGSWQRYFAQNRPYCDNNGPWLRDVNGNTTVNCVSGGYEMSQYSHSFAETDLDCPNGNCNYSQTQFVVKTHANLENLGDASVRATLLVQTPQNQRQHGGMAFAINSNGDWVLQQVNGSGGFDGKASGHVEFDPGNFDIQVTVQKNQLYSYINGQQVVQWDDSLNPSPGAVALMEESSNPTSSAILWSNFELDLWG